MADVGSRLEGRAAFEAGVDRLGQVLETKMRAVAWTSAERIRVEAQRLLRSQTHGTGKTANAIVRVEDEANHQFIVASDGDPSDPANLPIWLEFGTVHMQARPHMRPARDKESGPYQQAQQKAVDDALKGGIE